MEWEILSQIGCLGYNLKYFNYCSLLIQWSYVTILFTNNIYQSLGCQNLLQIKTLMQSHLNKNITQ